MDINYNFISFIDFLALAQGIMLGLLLVFGHRKNRPSLFLGLFLITYTAELTGAILSDIGVTEHYPFFDYLPFNFHFLSLPLLYLYAKSLVMPFLWRKNIIVLIPGIMEFVIFSILFLTIFFQGNQVLESGFWSEINNISTYISLLYSIFFAIQIIRLINQHKAKVLNYFSNASQRQLQWLKMIAYFIILFYSFWFVPLFLSDETISTYIYPVFSAINVIFIYWVGISGLRQSKVEMIQELPAETISEKVKIIENTSDKTIEENEIYQVLLSQMEEKELFKDSELTLPALAEKLKTTRRNLSQIINQKTQVNFNRFINQYRIEAAKKLLVDPKFDHLNMLGIAFEVGFNSKATFFSVFKQIENTSPGAYKKQHFSTK